MEYGKAVRAMIAAALAAAVSGCAIAYGDGASAKVDRPAIDIQTPLGQHDARTSKTAGK